MNEILKEFNKKVIFMITNPYGKDLREMQINETKLDIVRR